MDALMSSSKGVSWRVPSPFFNNQRLSNLPVQCNCYLYYVLYDKVPVFLVAALCDVWETSK